MNKKLLKRITAVIMVCTLVTSTAGSNTALAAVHKKNITDTSKPVKVNGKATKENNITESIKSEERTPELDKILNECEEIQTDGTSKEIRKGQMMSVESISDNYNTKAAITKNGDLYCWGYNRDGQIGNGTIKYQTIPVKILSDVKSVTYYCMTYYEYYEYSVSAITENGDLYCWGYNRDGQIGNGTTENQLTPVKVLSSVKFVSYSSDTHHCSVSAITENGDLYCWGNNNYGQVGNGTIENQAIPVKVLSDVKSISYGRSTVITGIPGSAWYYTSSVLAITEDGDLYCWGDNRDGQVGNGAIKKNQTIPVRVLSDVKSILFSLNADNYSVSAIMENGDLYCWGCNKYGQIGNGTIETQTIPVKILSDVKSISLFGNSVSAITENGDLYRWGYNRDGQIGNGTTKNQLTPVKILSEVKSITSSYYSVSAIMENGDLYCWGCNEKGQVGNGTTENQLTPVQVLREVKSIAYSSYYSVSAIMENGDLYCWGCNEKGQVGNGTTENQLTPVQVLREVKSIVYSSYYSVSAIMENGDLYCWGCNEKGQVGNGTTENQLTPVQVLSEVKSITYSSYHSVSAIMENGDLYCWGNNYWGQVGNGTTEDQLTPMLILGPSLTPGLNKDGCLQISDAITVEKGEEKYITCKIFADNLNQLKEIGDSLVWSSANSSVAIVEGKNYITPGNEDAREMLVTAKVTGISRGETDIFVSAPDGSKVCCHVVVSKPTGTVENPDDGYSYCFSIAGELQEVDTDNQTIKIDGINYEVYSVSGIDDAKEILEQHDNKIVACRVRATDNKIERIDDIKDIARKPAVLVKPEVDNINYEDGKFSKKNFKIDLEMYCDVEKPYNISDISDVIKKIDGLEVDFSKVSLTSSYNNTGEIPFLLKDGLLGSHEVNIEKELDFKLKPGQTKKVSVTAYVNDNLSVETVNADAVIEAKLNDDEKIKSTEIIHFCNLNMAREEEQKKLANSPKTPELKNMSNILNGSQMTFDDTALRECLTNTEVKAVKAQVTNWVYTSNALNSIINDDSDSSVLKKLLKKYGLTKEGLLDKVFKKLGIDKKVLTFTHPYKGTLKFEAKNKNTGKNITIKFTADMDFYGFGGSDSSYGGFGTLNYKISSGGSGTGIITFTNYDSFAASLKKVIESQIHNCFNKVYGEGINKIYNDLVADSFISATFAKIVNEKYGSGSELVYTSLKEGITGYTEEDAKESIKDIVIILTKSAIKKHTKISVHCPVDITVYDGDGNICAEIVDDVVNENYKDVAVYVKGDDKYLLLTDTDYILCYSGNDIGTMNYTVTEYEDDKPVRELIYNDVPLTTEKKYVNYLADGRHQGISLYNLNEIKGDVIEATYDIDKIKEQAVAANAITLSDKTLSLEKGQSYILMETISPDDAVSCDIIWSSSNDEVVEVNGSGILYAKAEGEAVITAKIDGRNLFASCKVKVVNGNTSSVSPTETPDTSPSDTPITTPSNTPRVTPSSLPSTSPTPKPTNGSSGSLGGYVVGGSVSTSTAMPSPTPTVTPVVTNVPDKTPTPTITPTPTTAPLATQAPALTPDTIQKPSASPVVKENNNTSSSVKLKKGAKVKDKKTKAVYKIVSTGKNKTAEYVKITKKNTTDIVIPASVKFKGKTFKVVSVGKGAFKNNKKLKSVKIGKNIKVIDKEAFSGCEKLEKVKMGKNITSIEIKAFNNCNSLRIITIPSKVNKIGKKAFYQCKNLQYILVKTKKLKQDNIGNNAFSKGYINPRVKTDKSVWKQYQAAFTAKGLSNKALFIINPVKLVI